MWNAAEYLKFADERSRPFFDLMGQVRAADATLVADLGCGTGHLTKTLCDRWPAARVVGVDSSADMLARATPLTIPGRLEFVRGDIAAWQPGASVDLLVSNAALHWLPDHDALLTRLAGMLSPDGTLAVQMPDRFHTPSHAVVEETVNDPRWAAALANVGLHRESVLPIDRYVHCLHDLGFAVNAWETIYVHVLTGADPVLNWLTGTALRPLLDRLPPDEQIEFLRTLGDRLRTAYPPRGDVTLFPMPRLFFVAARRLPASPSPRCGRGSASAEHETG